MGNIKDLKRRLGKKKCAPDSAGANAADERASSPASLRRPDSRVAASGRNEEKTTTDISQAHLRDPSPVPADEGRRGDPPEGGRCWR